ncbi:Hypothetical protein R9X50_00421200 [Acrodontium crateriforme]|uniref:Zn(2)-C6 fungal-type domain-containing protein n=1 Tax=Acrodontium crateriforme TaxID=150365 RepID=A0AAQ3M4B8_9PEZI|nr:Hypothetical protein R9X50_00421200 [Acrodontium crateriforme]
MPRPKKDTGVEPKKRSRTGCWPCKARKVKCGEEKPACANCAKSGETCDYSIRLNWGGRSRKEPDSPAGGGMFTFTSNPSEPSSTSQPMSHTRTNSGTVGSTIFGHESVFVANNQTSRKDHQSPIGEFITLSRTPGSEDTNGPLDPRLQLDKQMGWDAASFSAHQSSFSVNSGFTPPMSAHTPSAGESNDDFRWSPQHSVKRMRLESGSAAVSPPIVSHPSPMFAIQPPLDHSPSYSLTPHTISNIINTPTPGSSGPSGSPYAHHAATITQHGLTPPDLRRLSVKSLLVDQDDVRPQIFPDWELYGSRTYGYDHGARDLDIPHNDDLSGIMPKPSEWLRSSNAASEDGTGSGVDAGPHAFDLGGYYNEPVAVKIPHLFEPLHPELLVNQMNLLYFHHWINHTARVMIPHECPENSLRGVLPQMAMHSTTLLHLLLAYSASHRARLLGHPEPVNRIAEWMSDVLPGLRQAISEPQSPGSSDPKDPTSIAPLVTAVMLASLEILSPNIFQVPISWRSHLQMARQLIITRGGLDKLARHADGARDRAVFLVSRWFAYLDVMGALSGGAGAQLLLGAYDDDGGGLWLVNRSEEEIYQVDCFFGFSGKCTALLARVAQLAWQCDQQRIDPITHQVRVNWAPSEEVRQQANFLIEQLHASANTYRGCSHTAICPSPSDNDDVLTEIYATNQAYHWAGLLVISRRVLGQPSTAPEVQDMVQRVIQALSKQRPSGSADSCLIFPMFVAGCEALSQPDRAIFQSRMKEVFRWGLQHAGKAAEIMERVWETGQPWETLVEGEFLG